MVSEENVFRLEVTMHNVLVVEGFEYSDQLCCIDLSHLFFELAVFLDQVS